MHRDALRHGARGLVQAGLPQTMELLVHSEHEFVEVHASGGAPDARAVPAASDEQVHQHAFAAADAAPNVTTMGGDLRHWRLHRLWRQRRALLKLLVRTGCLAHRALLIALRLPNGVRGPPFAMGLLPIAHGHAVLAEPKPVALQGIDAGGLRGVTFERPNSQKPRVGGLRPFRFAQTQHLAQLLGPDAKSPEPGRRLVGPLARQRRRRADARDGLRRRHAERRWAQRQSASAPGLGHGTATLLHLL
mmetsp:Transcript_61257/g.177657  ORF Transcript_61257/g.177657 Transcript_61257/m.177657 type:complete len:247 (+) Transcript_61257:1048-1788(+)